ncbi:hypothetical protein [Candidatus Nitrosocosmicus sp. SS]|jgi:hypothetical protein|uniref:hypothetical protein n=1 Tax=Candidatus Nitrosocosmicus agrestis TaxID=2563600 RepID=UPI00122E971B|nr:hypothetical protein [Candidatus Nitrosocosmicus sp. SS]KAA2283531.1 hypothetical protein F1Z66_01210 [Candidatus Nitrosocosmicus sp. SS]KAF0869611.1 hypothetical protein E5N71_03740 [Candidatus Nitrosocosmicus sp. SS]MDR4490266.1 hypothetical protein [Candidatus Nitrosocosmicus sp.]
MQINANIKQLDSKEYKLILDSTRFPVSESHNEVIAKVIEKATNDLKLKFIPSYGKPKERTVWYLDTVEHDFYKNNSFTVRVKKKKKDNGKFEHDVTFKIRTLDKDKTLSYNLQPNSPQEEFKIEEKNIFEEDIISEYGSQFSLSTELEFKEDKYLARFKDAICEDVLSIFPSIKLDVLGDKTLTNVNGLKVQEITYELGEILFEDNIQAKMELSIWYLESDLKKIAEMKPIIEEFDIEVSLKNSDINNNNTENPFSGPSIEVIEDLYKKIQCESIVNLNGTTKTKFIYNYDKQET